MEVFSTPAEPVPTKRVLAFEPPRKEVPGSPGDVEADTLSQLLGGLYGKEPLNPVRAKPVMTPTELEVADLSRPYRRTGPVGPVARSSWVVTTC